MYGYTGWSSDADSIDTNIDPTELLENLISISHYGIFITNINLLERALVTFALGLVNDFLGSFCVEIKDDNFSAKGCKKNGRSRTDSTAATCNYCYLTF